MKYIGSGILIVAWIISIFEYGIGMILRRLQRCLFCFCYCVGASFNTEFENLFRGTNFPGTQSRL